MAKKKKSKKSNGDALATNRKALRDYTVIDRYEAGIVLRGTEVKSARNQQIGLTESYARVEKGEVFIYNLHIQPYEFGNRFNHPALRTRKLLLHAYEIKKLIGLTQLKGYSLIPLKCYLVRGHVKIQLGPLQRQTRTGQTRNHQTPLPPIAKPNAPLLTISEVPSTFHLL